MELSGYIEICLYKRDYDLTGDTQLAFVEDVEIETDKVCVPMKRWQKTTPLGAVFGTLSTKATHTPGRFNLVKTSQIANLSPIDSVEKSDLVKTSQIISLAPIGSVEKSTWSKPPRLHRSAQSKRVTLVKTSQIVNR